MIRRPPRSTLFPSRRSSDLTIANPLLSMASQWRLRTHWARRRSARSEEHTSELQSQSNLVCRLLLEKKKKKKKKTKMNICKKKKLSSNIVFIYEHVYTESQ